MSHTHDPWTSKHRGRLDRGRFSELEKRHERALEKQGKDVEARVGELEERLEGKEREIKAKEAGEEALRREKNELKREAAELRKKVYDLEYRLSLPKDRRATLPSPPKPDVAGLLFSLDKTSAHLNAAEASQHALEKELGQCRQKLQEKETAHDELCRRLEERDKEIEALKADLARLQAEDARRARTVSASTVSRAPTSRITIVPGAFPRPDTRSSSTSTDTSTLTDARLAETEHELLRLKQDHAALDKRFQSQGSRLAVKVALVKTREEQLREVRAEKETLEEKLEATTASEETQKEMEELKARVAKAEDKILVLATEKENLTGEVRGAKVQQKLASDSLARVDVERSRLESQVTSLNRRLSETKAAQSVLALEEQAQQKYQAERDSLRKRATTAETRSSELEGKLFAAVRAGSTVEDELKKLTARQAQLSKVLHLSPTDLDKVLSPANPIQYLTAVSTRPLLEVYALAQRALDVETKQQAQTLKLHRLEGEAAKHKKLAEVARTEKVLETVEKSRLQEELEALKKRYASDVGALEEQVKVLARQKDEVAEEAKSRVGELEGEMANGERRASGSSTSTAPHPAAFFSPAASTAPSTTFNSATDVSGIVGPMTRNLQTLCQNVQALMQRSQDEHTNLLLQLAGSGQI
ncbi:hypothetical protein JCM10207_004982 [Rhodosporidiobolus poonsookiae]